MKKRILLGVVLGVTTATIQIFIRPHYLVGDNSPILKMLLGSLPSLFYTIGVIHIFLALEKYTSKRKWYILAMTIGILWREFDSIGAEGGGEGNTFDYFDILATIIGGLIALYLETRFPVFLDEKLLFKTQKSN